MAQKNLGDYTLVKELGRGVLGDLYLAEHRFLKRPFALKVISEEVVSDPAFLERFEQEVMSLSSMDHPHIVKVHNISCSDGKYFLATDCIMQDQGVAVNLETYLEQHPGRLQEETMYKMAYQIASALDFVHEKKQSDQPLSHRALKLSNILIQELSDGPHVYLSDFGLSRLLGAGFLFHKTCKSISQAVEGKGQKKKSQFDPLQKSFMQSFAFLSPEQKEWQSSESYDERKADVYAFGVAVYFMLMRHYPEGYFEMPSERYSDLQYNWDALLRNTLHQDPKKRSLQLKDLVESIKASKDKNSIEGSKASPSPSETGLQLKLNLKPTEIVRPQFEPDPGAIFQTESVVVRYQPSIQAEKELDPLMTEMMIIPGGSFFRGSNSGGRDETPRHQVILSPFAIDVHQVTNEQYVRFLEVMGGEKDGNNNDMIRLRESRIKRSGGKLNIESGYARHPVVGVTWYGATAYAKWIGKRLPSEAEWEVAACGGLEDATYPTGTNIERPQANFFSSDTTSVMSYPPNNYGLYDMAGNVYEWCNDWYDYHYYNISVQEPNDPKGPLQGVYRVLRGGCWKSLKEDLRCSHRHRNNPGVMNGTYGFRCVADVEACN